MANPTRTQVHIDRAMTNVSIAYRNENYIASQLLPIVPVQKISDKFFKFDKSYWFRNEAGLRAPGTRGPVGEYKISSDTYSCKPVSFNALVPDETVANADPPLQMRRDATEFATDKVMLYAEYDVANIVFGNGSWAASSTPSPTWDDDGSDPVTDVEVGKEAVVKTIGREPNVLVMGREVWTDLAHHPDLLDRIKYTSPGIMTPQLLATIFQVERVLIGTAVYDSGAEGATASHGYIWGKSAALLYVPMRPSLMMPAAGYMFTWRNREAKIFRLDPEESDLVRVEWHYDPKITASDAGYEFKSCVA